MSNDKSNEEKSRWRSVMDQLGSEFSEDIVDYFAGTTERKPVSLDDENEQPADSAADGEDQQEPNSGPDSPADMSAPQTPAPWKVTRPELEQSDLADDEPVEIQPTAEEAAREVTAQSEPDPTPPGENPPAPKGNHWLSLAESLGIPTPEGEEEATSEAASPVQETSPASSIFQPDEAAAAEPDSPALSEMFVPSDDPSEFDSTPETSSAPDEVVDETYDEGDADGEYYEFDIQELDEDGGEERSRDQVMGKSSGRGREERSGRSRRDKDQDRDKAEGRRGGRRSDRGRGDERSGKGKRSGKPTAKTADSADPPAAADDSIDWKSDEDRPPKRQWMYNSGPRFEDNKWGVNSNQSEMLRPIGEERAPR